MGRRPRRSHLPLPAEKPLPAYAGMGADLEAFLARSKEGGDYERMMDTIFECRMAFPEPWQEFGFLAALTRRLRDDEHRKLFDSGDVTGLLNCLIAHKDDNLPLPGWALDALINAFTAYSSRDVPLEVALLGKPTLGRPPSRIANLLGLAAVFAAEREGYRGDEKFERAEILLAAHPRVPPLRAVQADRLRQLRIKKGQEELHQQARIISLIEFNPDPKKALTEELLAAQRAEMDRVINADSRNRRKRQL